MSTAPPPPPPPPPPAASPGPSPRPEPDRGPDPIIPAGDQPLAPRVVTLWRAGGALPMLVLLLVTVAIGAAIGGLGWLVPLAMLVLAVVVVGVLPSLRYRRWRWRMTGRALELEHGVVNRQVRALPYFRIQHIDVEHGPLDRWLGLARLEVHTASVTATLPGLAADDAPGIRAALLQLAGSAVAAERGDDAV
jgi:membrane protein YdbS with pleckstrin-like domain